MLLGKKQERIKSFTLREEKPVIKNKLKPRLISGFFI
jgi:hypothetical protein